MLETKKTKKVEMLVPDRVSNDVHLLALRYMGQQGVGVRALTSLQCWASKTGLPVKIVEPTILHSMMTGYIFSKESVTLEYPF